MRHSKKFTALLLCAALCACNSAPAETETSTSAASEATAAAAETTTTTAATTTTATTTTVPETTAAEAPPSAHGRTEITEYLEKKNTFEKLIIDGEEYTYPLTVKGSRGDREHFSQENGLLVSEHPAAVEYLHYEPLLYSGEDTALAENAGDENHTLRDAMNYTYYALDGARENLPRAGRGSFFSTPLYIDADSAADNGRLYASDAWYSVYTESEITVNAFIRRNGDTAELIVDPEYSMELPNGVNWETTVDEGLFRHDINGVPAIMTAPKMEASLADGVLPELGGDYIYAAAVLDRYCAEFHYAGSRAEYSCSVKSAEVIEPDAAKALTSVYLDMEGGKPDAMSQMYNELVAMRDHFLSEDFMYSGIQLTDLDLDGTPELMLNYFPDRRTDVYRLENGKLTYADTFRPLTGIDDFGNQMLCDSENKRWLLVYSDENGWNTGYMRLTESGLEFDPVFTEEKIGWKDKEENEKFYYKGKLFDESADIYPAALEILEEHKNNAYSLSQAAKTAYIEQLEGDVYYTSGANPFWYYDIGFEARIPQTDRMFRYNIARIVDDAFLGEYNSARREKNLMFNGAYAKPVIYLYPEQETKVSVSVDFANGGEMTCSYPEYNGGWKVTALPDGTLCDEDGNEYYCLYWEGRDRTVYDNSRGWCVPGSDTADFLREKLLEIGLTAREANEFIIYWLPVMRKNPYNIITLHTGDYAAAVPLGVSPAPDSVIRVFMTFKASDEAAEIQPQELPRYERNGFTLVEWGGADISEY